MENIKKNLSKVPSEFWLNNGLLGFILYLLTSERIFFIILFPLAVFMIRYICSMYLKDISIEYVGVYPIKNDLKWALITFVVSFAIFKIAIPILILGAIFIIWQERQA